MKETEEHSVCVVTLQVCVPQWSNAGIYLSGRRFLRTFHLHQKRQNDSEA